MMLWYFVHNFVRSTHSLIVHLRKPGITRKELYTPTEVKQHSLCDLWEEKECTEVVEINQSLLKQRMNGCSGKARVSVRPKRKEVVEKTNKNFHLCQAGANILESREENCRVSSVNTDLDRSWCFSAVLPWNLDVLPVDGYLWKQAHSHADDLADKHVGASVLDKGNLARTPERVPKFLIKCRTYNQLL